MSRLRLCCRRERGERGWPVYVVSRCWNRSPRMIQFRARHGARYFFLPSPCFERSFQSFRSSKSRLVVDERSLKKEVSEGTLNVTRYFPIFRISKRRISRILLFLMKKKKGRITRIVLDLLSLALCFEQSSTSSLKNEETLNITRYFLIFLISKS